MYNEFYTFFEKSEPIYSFHFSLRANYSTTNALIHLTEIISKKLDDANYGCGIFVDFKK